MRFAAMVPLGFAFFIEIPAVAGEVTQPGVDQMFAAHDAAGSPGGELGVMRTGTSFHARLTARQPRTRGSTFAPQSVSFDGLGLEAIHCGQRCAGARAMISPARRPRAQKHRGISR